MNYDASPYYDYFGDGNYNYYGSSGLPENFWTLFMTIAIGFVVVALLVSLVFYIFNAIALYSIAKRRRMNNAFLAFIPIANKYYLGKIADDISRTMNKKTNHAKRILIPMVIGVAIDVVGSFFAGLGTALISLYTGGETGVAIIGLSIVISLFSGAALIVSAIFKYIALYSIFKEYSNSNAVLFIILSVLLSISPFLLFAIRNKKSGYELWCEQQTKQAENTAFYEDSSNQSNL